jgi:transcriptional regulator with XRE-family HTH domain
MSFAERFAANLRRCRKRTGLSQQAAAVRASLSFDAVGKYECAEQTPTLDTLIRLAGALSVSVDELLEGLAWKPAYFGGGPGRYRFSGSDIADAH